MPWALFGSNDINTSYTSFGKMRISSRALEQLVEDEVVAGIEKSLVKTEKKY